MRNNRKVIAGMIAAAALAVSGSLVYAQDKAPGQGGYQSGGRGADRGEMRHGPRGGHEHRGHHGKWSNPKAAVEGHLAALKVELKITPAQENAWQAFSTKTRQRTDAMIARHEQRKAQPEATNQTAPERMAQHTERMKQRIAGMEARTAAVKDLYAVLTPEQKAIADKQFSRGSRHGRHGGRGEHGNHFKNNA
ncbi:MAG: Spy/CpxP family protein refolding chaperone [Burkholderiales bacterium]